MRFFHPDKGDTVLTESIKIVYWKTAIVHALFKILALDKQVKKLEEERKIIKQ